MVMATEIENETEAIPSVKDLASSEPSLRRKNLQQIITHLESRPSSHHLTHTQALQLWRGFHVALYMHDSKNQLSVQTLIATLASTFEIVRSKDASTKLPSKNSTSKNDADRNEDDGDEFSGFDDAKDTAKTNVWLATYSTAFWETIAREWSGVDQWRLNKYLSLVRFATREILKISLLAHYGLEDNNTSQDETAATNPKKRKDTDTPAEATKPKKKAKTSDASSTSSPQKPSPDKPAATTQLSLLGTHPLSPRGRTTPDGLRLHTLDIYVDELFNAVDTLRSRSTTTANVTIDDRELSTVLTETFMRPVREIGVDGLSRNVRGRAKDVLAEFEARRKDVLGS